MLNIDGLKDCVVKGIKGFEVFYQQFDVFQLKLTKYDSIEVPFVMLSIERHKPFIPIKEDGEGEAIQNKILKELESQFPGVKFELEGGYSGGNSRGWDLWRSISLGTDEQSKQLQFDEDIVLFRFETHRIYPK